MNSHNRVATNMEYIQKVFLCVQVFMQKQYELEDLIPFLESEPPEFRSIAYEAASMEIGLRDLALGKELNNWKKFYCGSAEDHTFHMDIGLGWAFAKTEISPTPFLKFLQPAKSWMVFDGIGYYYGLFKGRRTVRNQLVPEDVIAEDWHGFDQGLGRRLWYISKGEVSVLTELLQPFHTSRQGDLWRGIGIACGYVGGSDKWRLEQLLNCSTAFKDQLCTGVTFAAISRAASNSVTQDLVLACEIICQKTRTDVLSFATELRERI